MKTILYKGYHSAQAFDEFKNAYQNNNLIIYLPPQLSDYSFVEQLPAGEIQLKGELWGNEVVTISPQGNPMNGVAGVFSSGTSQTPKLVLYSKKNLESSIKGIYSLFDQSKISNLFCYPQPFHTLYT